MVFSKRFPRSSEGSPYVKWVNVTLSEEEEKETEQHAREDNTRLFKESIEDAQRIIIDKNLKSYQTDVISIATALFEKRASHVVFWKENRCKQKFDASATAP